MKKIIFLLIMILVLTTGCGKKEVKELSLKEKISKKYDYYTKIKCSGMGSEIVDLEWLGFSTKDKAYELSYDKLYSNNENCKEVPVENLDGEIIVGSGDNYVSTKTTRYYIGKGMQHSIESNEEYALLSTLGNNVLYHHASFKSSPLLVSVDNKIKLITTKYKDREMGTDLDFKKIIDIDYTFDSDEQVEKLSDRFIKTNKAYYIVKQINSNKKECEKYVDIPCKYEYKIIKDKVLTANYNDILFAGEYILDKDYNVYYYKNPNANVKTNTKKAK